MTAVDLAPYSVRVRPARRLAQLLVGLVLYGVGVGLQIRATLGLNPWDVLHEGVTTLTGLTFGQVSAITGVLVLLLWIPLRQRPGIGTVANVVIIAVTVDVTLAIVPAPSHLGVRTAMLLGAVVLGGVATASYIGVRLGPGPRDGLMTGLHRRTGWSVRLVRTIVEVSVLVLGFLLGGTVGIGTVLYAVAIGPLTQLFLPLVVVGPPPPRIE